MSDIETYEANRQVEGLRWRTAADGSRVLQALIRFDATKYRDGVERSRHIGRQEWRDVLDQDASSVSISPPPPPPPSEAPPLPELRALELELRRTEDLVETLQNRLREREHLQREIFVVETPKGTPLWSTARGGATETIRSYNHMRGRDPNGPLPGGYQVARYQTVRGETI